MKRLENHSEYVTEAKEAYAYSSVKKKKKKSKMEASPSQKRLKIINQKFKDKSISEPEVSQNNQPKIQDGSISKLEVPQNNQTKGLQIEVSPR